jgi:hypothetical protein
MKCPHCEANERVKISMQEILYRADKARVEAEARARIAEEKLAEIADVIGKVLHVPH